MNHSIISICNDDSFGPIVRCRDGFDFTLVFEESIFTVLPSALLLCFVPLRFWSIYKRPDAVKWPLLRLLKFVGRLLAYRMDADLLDHDCRALTAQVIAAYSVDTAWRRANQDDYCSSGIGCSCCGSHWSAISGRALKVVAAVNFAQCLPFLHHAA